MDLYIGDVSNGLKWLPGALRHAIFVARNTPRALGPVSMDDKIRRKMLRDRRPYLTRTADKVKVRDYVASLTPDLLSRAYQVTSSASDLNWDSFPAGFVVKSNHGCAGSVIVSDQGKPLAEFLDSNGRLPRKWTTFRIRPQDVAEPSRRLVEEYLAWILTQRYGWGSPIASTFEWAYRNIEPQLLVEELLLEEGTNPIDYRFFVVNGCVSWIQRDFKRNGEHFSSVHLPSWEMLNVRYNYDMPPEIPLRPLNLSLMINAAETLAAETDFCRIDFYDLGDRVVFGEITHYPRGGNNDFQPRAWGVSAGATWAPPWKYR